MRKILIPSLAFLVAATLFAPVGARADHRGIDIAWSIASSFRIGGADISLVFARPGVYGAPVASGYYYRTSRRLPAYYGHHCTDRCFVQGGVYYHDASCPLVGAYLSRYDFPVNRFWIGAGPLVVRPPVTYYRLAPPVRRYAPRVQYYAPRVRRYAPRVYRYAPPSYRSIPSRDWRDRDRDRDHDRGHDWGRDRDRRHEDRNRGRGRGHGRD